jgi:hypothetical protein
VYGILKNTKEHNVSETGSVSILVPQTVLVAGKNVFTDENLQMNPMHWCSWIWFDPFNFHLLSYLSFRSVQALSQLLLYIFLSSPIDKS